VQILGVSFDDVAANKAFAEKFDFKYPLLCDTSRALGLAYGAADDAKQSHAKRISYLIDPDGKIRHVWEKVDTSHHFADVLEQIEDA
jgi:peroxiredoxin Q/BCP